MSEETRELVVNIKQADAGPVGWIAYSIATWIAWASLCGFVTSKAYLLMGIISLSCSIPYFVAAFSQLKLGNVAGGCTWTYFGAFFAFNSALTYIVTYFAPIYGWQLDYRILGYVWFFLALVLIFTTPIFLKYAPASASISVIAADVGLITLALMYWNVGGLAKICGWSFFVAGFFGLIMSIGGILEGAGMKFPMGKPLMK